MIDFENDYITLQEYVNVEHFWDELRLNLDNQYPKGGEDD